VTERMGVANHCQWITVKKRCLGTGHRSMSDLGPHLVVFRAAEEIEKLGWHAMRQTSLTVALVMVLSLPAFGGYIGSYADWRALKEGQKLGYVMGAFDSGLTTFSENDPYSEANSRGISSCTQQSKLDSGMLVQLVETNYAQNPDSWALPPSVVLSNGLFAICKTYINTFRRAKGLDLLK
jgi:hypothetical protein